MNGNEINVVAKRFINTEYFGVLEFKEFSTFFRFLEKLKHDGLISIVVSEAKNEYYTLTLEGVRYIKKTLTISGENESISFYQQLSNTNEDIFSLFRNEIRMRFSNVIEKAEEGYVQFLHTTDNNDRLLITRISINESSEIIAHVFSKSDNIESDTIITPNNYQQVSNNLYKIFYNNWNTQLNGRYGIFYDYVRQIIDRQYPTGISLDNESYEIVYNKLLGDLQDVHEFSFD
jgi:DNA-binding PadR family transcriptional regulator